MGQESRAHDVVVFGASGFTGRLVLDYLTRSYPASELRLAVSGRNRAKLDEVVRATGRELPILVADSFDDDALGELARSARVVCTTVGPYAKYGAKLVAACVEAGTDYCDLTGEPQFIRRMIERHHEAARASGARIVHCCGFDSIPSDLGTLMMQDAMMERHGVYAREVKFVAGEQSGAFSGGTIASMFTMMEEAKRDPKVRRILGHPYALNPEGERDGPDGSDQRGVRYDSDLGLWTGPFVMAAINTRVVRRSHALAGYPWGRDFRYSETMSFGRGPKGALVSAALAGGLNGFIGLAAFGPTRSLLARKLPKPGEGPSKTARERGHFTIRFVAKGYGAERKVKLNGVVMGQQDPGYGETSKMLGESAVCLARGEGVPGGGVLTPATAMGARLTQRLRDAGMTFRVE